MASEHEKEQMTVLSNEDDLPAEGGAKGLENLLHPISQEMPSGEDLRYDSVYDAIKEAGRADDPSLPQGVWERELKKADWKKVQEICILALESRTKDIQIAVWLMEAMMHLNGFTGLRDGLTLLKGLCERFWETLYPEIDEEDGPEMRVSPFVWMNETLSTRLKMIRISEPDASMDAQPLTFLDWEEAEELEKLSSKDKNQYEEAVAGGRMTRARFLGSVMFSSKSFYQAQIVCLDDSLVLLNSLERFLDDQCGKDAPGFGRIREVLARIKRLMQTFLQERIKNGDDGDDADIHEDEKRETGVSASRDPISSLTIRNRAEAYKLLSAAADYLLIHEPHSPTPHLVKRAVSWGNMSLSELLQELVMDEHDLNQIFKLLGLKGPM